MIKINSTNSKTFFNKSIFNIGECKWGLRTLEKQTYDRVINHKTFKRLFYNFEN